MESSKVISTVIFRLLIGSIIISGMQEGYSQTSGNDSLVTRHRLQLLFGNGVMLNKATLVNGEHVPETAISFSHSLHCNYQWVLSRRISLTAGYALGIQAFSSYVAPFGEETGSRTVLFADHADYFRYHQLSAEAAFRFKTGRNDMMSLFAGGGTQRLRSGTFGCTSHVEGFEQSRIYLKIEGNWFPFATAGGEYYHALKNSDQLYVRLFYQYSFRNWYQGTYYIYEGTSSGDLHATGSRVSLGVGYVFTGISREGKINVLEQELGSRREAKQALRSKKRFVDPSAGFLSVYSGFALAQTRFSDPNHIYSMSTFPATTFMLSFEKGIGKNFFLEGVYHTHQYMAGPNPGWGLTSGWYFSTINMHNISMGGGFRLCHDQHIPLLSFHAGLFSGFHFSEKGMLGEGSITNILEQTGDTIFHETYEATVKSNVGAGLYTALSKDIRISNRLYLSAKARYQWGFVEQFGLTVDYLFAGKHDASGVAIGSFRNTSYYAMLGLKLKI